MYTNDTKGILIEELTEMEDLMKIPTVISRAWQLDLEIDLFSTEERQVSLSAVRAIIQQLVPPTEIKAVIHVGGMAIGAFTADENKKMIGFIYAVPEHVNPMEEYLVPIKKAHHSHMMGIIPEYQHQGVGFQLKLAHRNLGIKRGINLITWTFDPLLSANAYLNFHKLGGITRKFYPNFYGKMDFSPLYEGVPSDRLMIEWYVESRHVKTRLEHSLDSSSALEQYLNEGYQEILGMRTAEGFVEPPSWKQVPSPPIPGLILQVPEDSVLLRKMNPDLNKKWRFFLRNVFTRFVNIHGYVVNDYLSIKSKDGTRKNFYVLSRDIDKQSFKKNK